jgi:dienelactone hydrolase
MRQLIALAAILLALSAPAFPDEPVTTDLSSPPPSPAPGAKPPAPPAPEEVDAASLDAARPGIILHTRLAGGRPFSLYLPQAYDASRPWPLLIELTGRGIGRENIRRMCRTADAFGLIVAAPDTYAIFGPPGQAAEVTRTHEAWSRSGESVDVPQTVRDQEAILADLAGDARAIGDVVDALAARFTVEREAVVLTGYSGGAWAAYYTGLSAPGKYAGICIRSGTFHPGVMPDGAAAARKLPINVVVGDRDLEMVLADTAKAEVWFKRMQFERFQVERLPHSGHDNRPEAAGNFARFVAQEVQARRLAAARKEWDKFLRAGRRALEAGEPDKARHWLEKAAALEREHGLEPAEATQLLETLAKPAAEEPPPDAAE